MSVQETIGQAIAIGQLAKARALGETILLYHRANSAVTLYVLVPKVPGGAVGEQDGPHLVEGRAETLSIPTGQAGFAYPSGNTEPVVPGDYYTRRSRTYQILEIQTEDYGYTYTVKSVQKKHVALGAVK